MFNGQNLSPEELEMLAAQNLSNFNGGNGLSHFGGGLSLYTGENDDMLEFDGDNDIENFAGEGSLQRQFTFTVDNNNTSSVLRARIFSGYNLGSISLAPGQIKDGFFADILNLGTGSSNGLTGSTGGEKQIYELVQYLMFNPSRVVGMKIQSDNALQIQQDFILKPLSPFKTTDSKYIRPKDYQNQGVFQDKLVVFKTDFQLDNQTELLYSFVPNSTTSITLIFGASLNNAKALSRKAKKAKTNIAAVGQANVIGQSLQNNAVKYIG